MINEKDYILLLKAFSAGKDICLCDYCIYHVPCKGKNCAEFCEGHKVTDPDGNEVEFRWTCMDFNFGQCPLLEDTPCNDCNDDNFLWNGKIYDGGVNND